MLNNICLKKSRSYRIINVTDNVGCSKAFGFQMNTAHSRDKLCDVYETRRAFIAFGLKIQRKEILTYGLEFYNRFSKLKLSNHFFALDFSFVKNGEQIPIY